MDIEEGLSQTNLEVLSNFLIKIREEKQSDNLENYAISYGGAINSGISNINVYFSSSYVENGSMYRLQNIWQCRFKLNQMGDNGYEPITWENFDYQSKINNCTNGGNYDFLKDISQATGSSRHIASNLYKNNYLDYLKYQTLEVAPSPEPEEPSPETTDYTNWFILISAILMLIVMYRFIGSLFSRGD